MIHLRQLNGIILKSCNYLVFSFIAIGRWYQMVQGGYTLILYMQMSGKVGQHLRLLPQYRHLTLPHVEEECGRGTYICSKKLNIIALGNAVLEISGTS